MRKKLLNVLEVLTHCPNMYQQNIDSKSVKWDKQICYDNGFEPGTDFTMCPLWKKRENCWMHVYEKYTHFNQL